MQQSPTPTPELKNDGLNRFLKVLLPVAVILVLVVGGLFLVKSQVARQGTGGPTEASQFELGKNLPDFELYPFGAAPFKASSLPSKVTLINFWATWCEACMVEMPSILKLRETYKSKGFDVVAINLDQNPDAVLPRILKKLGIDFTVFIDKDQKLADLFRIEAIPLTVVIDKNRKVLMIENGEKDWNGAEFRTELEKWLNS